jgi:hypothetical protein
MISLCHSPCMGIPHNDLSLLPANAQPNTFLPKRYLST